MCVLFILFDFIQQWWVIVIFLMLISFFFFSFFIYRRRTNLKTLCEWSNFNRMKKLCIRLFILSLRFFGLTTEKSIWWNTHISVFGKFLRKLIQVTLINIYIKFIFINFGRNIVCWDVQQEKQNNILCITKYKQHTKIIIMICKSVRICCWCVLILSNDVFF